MSLIDTFVRTVTDRSSIVIVLMLVLTVGLGVGMASLGNESGLSQFQFDSEEQRALDEIDATFEDSDQETTAVQIVIRDDENVLTRESFLQTLELQEEIRNDQQINATLADERAFADLGEIVATTAIRQERAAELESRQSELEADREELEADQQELEADQEELEADQQELEADQQELETDQQELEETAAVLTDGLNETRELEEEFTRLNASLERGEIDRQAYQSGSEELATALAQIRDDVASRLDGESLTAYEGLRAELRTLVAESVATERRFQQGELTEEERDQQLAELRDQISGIYNEIQTTVLGEEFTELQQRGQELQQRAEDLEQRGADLQERGEDLQARGEELQERGEQLQADSDQLRNLDPTLEQQRTTLEEISDEEFQTALDAVLGEDAPNRFLSFVPVDYNTGSGDATARQLFITQTTDKEIAEGEAPPAIEESQLEIAEYVDERFGDTAFVFGPGIISDEITRSMGDSIAIVLPLAFVFVFLVLSIAYRDPLDIVLGMLGIGMVLVWTFGFMGWAGINFNQIMIAVPVLLVGLSIDYAIHVFMRHREQRHEDSEDTRESMRVVLVGLGSALLWVTITAVIGFLSNLVSPVAPIREFGMVSAFGIASTLIIFGTFVPATKVKLDAILEARGWDRKKQAFGTEGGIFTRILAGGHTLAKRAPIAVVIVVLLITAGGAYGAMQVDTTFQQEDFIADDPPEWMDSLPGPFAPGEYTVKENLAFVNDNFLRQDTNTQVLIEGDITSDDTLTDIDEATDIAAQKDVVVTFSDGQADIRNPLSAMEEVAANNETFATTFNEADTDGDGVPDEDVSAVYDAFYEADAEAASDVIYRNEDGEYDSMRMVISIKGNALASDATTATRDVADSFDREAIATGQLVVFNIVEDELFNTVIESLIVTLVAVFAFLMVAYRIVHDSAILGAITLTPIVLTVAWILGTMSLLGISFNVLTGTITSLTIGLGVAYNIHMTERYRLELERGKDVWESLRISVTGTGGALLGSAATTVGGFGVLALAILPPLQQFGIITGITIIYAFLGSVFILPSFLVLWTRYLGPAEKFPDET
jgi:predicted RND superfamily exporter protein